MRMKKEIKLKIAEAVWLDRLGSLTTSEVAQKFEISVSQAYRELMKILRGRCDLFPFQYQPDDDGVVISTGRTFVRNGEDNDSGKAHSYWFCN
jgi:hypothetical protein